METRVEREERTREDGAQQELSIRRESYSDQDEGLGTADAVWMGPARRRRPAY